jgi:hypothetical protein
MSVLRGIILIMYVQAFGSLFSDAKAKVEKMEKKV